ncbi:hypothetical protein GQ44DRAFT_763053 [Phaeosphaeriaceae sp. PMI808]|nr:hypothetical protein GQ44DRAFT_763053 [Phaeosphaeriaceae sp. PMI808]
MSTVTARCYTCHELRPLSDFKYRQRDNEFSVTAQFKRYVGVLFQRPGASKRDNLRNAGAIYRYRCVDPRSGSCPKIIQTSFAERLHCTQRSLSQAEARTPNEGILSLRRHRRQSDFLGHEVEVEIEVCEDQRPTFRQEKDDAKEKLRQCVDMRERNAVDQ